MNLIRKALDAVTVAMLTVAGACLILMMVVVVLDITLKYSINQPVPGALEMVSFYFMGACAFLPFVYVQKMEHHVVMTLATDWMRPAALRILQAFIYLTGAAYLALFAWASGAEAMEMTRIGEITSAGVFEIVIWPARWSVPLATGLTACWMVLQAVTNLGRGRHD